MLLTGYIRIWKVIKKIIKYDLKLTKVQVKEKVTLKKNIYYSLKFYILENIFCLKFYIQTTHKYIFGGQESIKNLIHVHQKHK